MITQFSDVQTKVSEIVAQRISDEGPVSFHDFMEMALYYPELGYYASSGKRIGKCGDFYTSSSLTPLFGEMIAKQLSEMWEQTGKGKFTIVEYGAGTGELCHDILSALIDNHKLYEQISYCIIEKSPAMREAEFGLLGSNEKVSWADSINDLGEFSGCVLTNEVLDNFSVHVVVMEDDLMEVYVGYEEGFYELLKPASKELREYLAELRMNLPQEFRTEINLEAIAWLKEIAAVIRKGFVLTIDYGWLSSELLLDDHRNGTIECYSDHQVTSNPYENVGEQDITSHVNFSALNHWGSELGLKTCGFTDQYHFLHALGINEHLRRMEEKISLDSERLALWRQASTLLNDMGTKFKILIQQKGMMNPRLTGLMFSRQLPD